MIKGTTKKSKIKRYCEKAKKNWVTSCELLVQIYDLRVEIFELWVKIHKLRVQIHTSYEVKSTIDEEELNMRVSRWKSRVEAIKPRIR